MRVPRDVVDLIERHHRAWRCGRIARDHEDFADEGPLLVSTGIEYDRAAHDAIYEAADDLLVAVRREQRDEVAGRARAALVATDNFFFARLEHTDDTSRFLPEVVTPPREPYSPEMEAFWSDVQRAFDEPDPEGVHRLGYFEDEESWRAGDRTPYDLVLVDGAPGGAIWIAKNLLYRARHYLRFRDDLLIAPWSPSTAIEKSVPAL